MDDILLYIFLVLSSLLISVIFLRRPRLKLPPSPPFCLPIIGHLYLIKQPVHRTFQKLSQKYGDVLSLRFGSRLVVVISSPSAVQECFTKNDIVLANRPCLSFGKYLAYNNTTMILSPYGEHWRHLRRIGTVEIFSANRLNLFSRTRQEEVKHLMRKVLSNNSFEEFSKVKFDSMFLDLTSNIVMRMVAGKKYCRNNESGDGQERRFREMVTEILKTGGATNPGDFIPIWNMIDPAGFKKKLMDIGERSDALLQGLVDEIRNGKGEEDTMIDHLLHLQNTQPENYNDQIIKGLVQVILLGGIDTSAVTLEWALSHMLNNPEVLKKARVEIDSFIGQDRMVEEADLPSLSYLQGIISETLRLSPAAPLLVGHCASEDCTIEGYDIPRDTIILVNAWTIHRDSKVWEDATSFMPERHENNAIGSTNTAFKLLPFGFGRRACPGVGMAQRIIGLTLASLIHCFEWERVDHELIDMTEGKGATMHKLLSLEAMCKPRPIMRDIYIENNKQY